MSTDLAQLAVYGLVVFPLPAGAKFPPPPGWQHMSTDPTALAGGNAGVGCRINHLVILDVDQPGEFAAFCAAVPGRVLPDTLTVVTPSGGRHLYYRAPARPVVYSVSGHRSPLPGVDVRGPGRRSGGYVVAPGSVVAGRPYTVTVHHTPAALPDWLTTILTPNARGALPAKTATADRRPADQEGHP